MNYKLPSVGEAINHKNTLRTYLICTVKPSLAANCLLSHGINRLRVRVCGILIFLLVRTTSVGFTDISLAQQLVLNKDGNSK